MKFVDYKKGFGSVNRVKLFESLKPQTFLLKKGRRYVSKVVCHTSITHVRKYGIEQHEFKYIRRDSE